MFCPKCKAEYRDGFLECADCKVSLITHLPPEPEQHIEYEYVNLVKIKAYTHRHEADLAKGILSVNGIEAVFQEGEFGILPRLLVKEEDVQKAKKILNDAG